MRYCRRCGTENSDDVSFCRKCGTSLAAVGSAGTSSTAAPAARLRTDAKSFKSSRARLLGLVIFVACYILAWRHDAALAAPHTPAARQYPPAQFGRTRVNPKDGAEMVFVPAAYLTMGSNVHLDSYWIYKSPVTVARHYKFCQDTGRQMPPFWRNYYNEQYDRPITHVSWYGANAYAQWAGVRLPTVAEWDTAALGVDMAGNVRQWCRDRSFLHLGEFLVRGGYGKWSNSDWSRAGRSFFRGRNVGCFCEGTGRYNEIGFRCVSGP